MIPALLWSGIALFGIVNHALSLRDALRTKRVVEESGLNHGADILALARIRAEVMRGVCNIIALAIGIDAIFPFIPSTVVVGGFLLFLTSLNVATFLDRRDQRQLVREAMVVRPPKGGPYAP